MNIRQCILFLPLFINALDTAQYSLEIKQIMQYPSSIKEKQQEDFRKHITIQTSQVEMLKKRIEDDHYCNVVCQNLAPIYLTLFKKHQQIAFGETNYLQLADLSNEIPEISPFLSELKARTTAYHRFLVKN